MKRKTKPAYHDSYQHRFPPMPVFRDQLDDIFDIANTRGLSIKIADDDYEYSDLDDLQKGKGDRIGRLSISFVKEDAKSSLRNASAKLTYDEALFGNVPTLCLTSEREDRVAAFYQETRALLEKQVPWFAKALRPTTSVLAAAILSFVYSGAAKGSALAQVASSASLVCFIWGLFAYGYLRRCRYLNLKRSHEVEGFWQRNSDKILVAVITAIISSSITLFVNRYFNPQSQSVSPATDTTKLPKQ